MDVSDKEELSEARGGEVIVVMVAREQVIVGFKFAVAQRARVKDEETKHVRNGKGKRVNKSTTTILLKPSTNITYDKYHIRQILYINCRHKLTFKDGYKLNCHHI